MTNLELNEQELFFLIEHFNYELESEVYSSTRKAIINGILKKLEA